MSKQNRSPQPPVSFHEMLCIAINNKQFIEFEYKQCGRIAEPHDYGMIDGVKKLLTYQIEGESQNVEGESQNGRLPDWRWADVDISHACEYWIINSLEREPRPLGSILFGIAASLVSRCLRRTHADQGYVFDKATVGNHFPYVDPPVVADAGN